MIVCAMNTGISLPRICITATGRTAAELLECARRALAHSRFVELRLDWVAQPADAVEKIATLLKDATQASPRRALFLQATCRRRPHGGKFRGSVARQIDLLLNAISAGCRVVDLEIESAEAAGLGAVQELRKSASLILSFHDFQRTPPLGAVARRLRRFPADYYKIVPTATRQTDNCAVLEFLAARNADRKEHGEWVAFAMGEAGVPSRVLALARGSAFLYAAPVPVDGNRADTLAVSAAAPGQLDWQTLRIRYRVEQLSQQTAVYGLLGHPVGHSAGTALHNAAFRARHRDAVYLPLLSDNLADFCRAAARYPLAGFSITIPHKQAVLRFVDKSDQWVKLAGAVNTVRIRRGRWEATNTDIAGIVVPLQRAYRIGAGQRLPKGFRAVIVGYGGAARAAVIALQLLGCRDISIAGRHRSRARQLAAECGCKVLPLDALTNSTFDLLIHATPVGMWPHDRDCLLEADQLGAKTVFDLIYNPPETRLLRMARQRGCQTISGLEMFLAQAARQFEFWTGERAPLSTMRRAAEKFLAGLRATAERRGSTA